MAVNMALGVHCGAAVNVPVHRNLILLKLKATPMASFASNNSNPASKFGALQLPTATPTKGKSKTTIAAQSGSTSGNGQTTIQFVNSTGSVLSLKEHKFWLGNKNAKDIPEKIIETADYTHTVDESGGSVGGLVYLLDELVYWVVAWKNTTGSNKNKVYTDIITIHDYDKIAYDQGKFWSGIYKDLMKNSSTCNKDEADLGYLSQLNITPGDSAIVSASLSNYKNN